MVKIAFNTMLNSKSRGRAIKSLVDRREKPEDWPFRSKGASEDAAQLIRLIEAANLLIREKFNSGIGLQYQRIDSDLLIKVLRHLAAKGLSGLPLHDAVICPQSEATRVQEIMDSEFQRLFPNLKFRRKVTAVELL